MGNWYAPTNWICLLTGPGRSHPDFTLSGVGLQPYDVYWPLVRSSAIAEAGYETGFDFASDPVIDQATRPPSVKISPSGQVLSQSPVTTSPATL